MSLGLYLHIPYCFSKCRYCDFYSAPGVRGVPAGYTDALLRELTRFAPDAPLHPDTLYFGGGTPSLLRPADAARLIEAAQPLPGAEIDPGSQPRDRDGADPARVPCSRGKPHLVWGAVRPGHPAAHTGPPPIPQNRPGPPLPPPAVPGLKTSAATLCWHCPITPRLSLTRPWSSIQQGGATHISAYLLKNRAGLCLWAQAAGGTAHPG